MKTNIISTQTDRDAFQNINRGYNSVFKTNKLSIGLVVPIESYMDSSVPTMDKQIARIQMAEALGFSAVWLRDVPFNVPSFGDAGQIYDPFVYLGLLAGQTERIAIGTASIILPLRHPAHVAKAAASIDVMSEGRFILGVASGDRPEEYPALDVDYSTRGENFRESVAYFQQVRKKHPTFSNAHGNLDGHIDMLPKPAAGRLPLLITGSSQQDLDWIAKHGDGWMIYPRGIDQQEKVIAEWRARVSSLNRQPQPVMQPLYIDLTENPDTPPTNIHLGIRTGVYHLKGYLNALENIGVNHVALNMRFNQADVETTLKRLADKILTEFSS